MKAQCCICAEHFVNDPSIAIAAVHCGHTFHDACLSKWLQTANTCPSCRSNVERGKVIKRLFFDGGEAEEENEDFGKLSNEIQNLKANLRERDKEKSELTDDNASLRKHLKDMKKEKKELEMSLKQEHTSSSSLKKQLHYFQSKQVAIEEEKQECRTIKQKFIQYQNIDKMLSESDSEIQEMLNRYDTSSGSVQQLVRQCTLLKREYDKLKVEKKAIKTEFDKYKRENFVKERQMKDMISEINILREKYQRSEEDLKYAEKEESVLKRKINHLKKIIKNPASNAGTSFMETLMNDSSATVTSVTTPVLFNDSTNSGREIDLDAPNIHSVSPEILKPESSSSQVKRTGDEENCVKYLKISSAASGRTTNPAKKLKREMNDLGSMNRFNIFKKKSGVGDYSSNIRTGYNGFGGVETFTQPSGRPKVMVTKKSVSRVHRNGKLIKVPPLPTLDNFISID